MFEELALRLYDIHAVKFGDFTTKSGIKTPVYFDLRVIVSYPDVMALISNLMCDFVKSSNCHHLCGVPYTALPIATLLSVESKKPMLMRRKEAKSYGTKKMIEGHYKEGDICLIVEDVITSGSSILETVKDLHKEGLVVNEAIIILDRQQGGLENLSNNNITVKSLFTMTNLIEILLKNNKITEETASEVVEYIKGTKVPNIVKLDRVTMPYETRAELASNEITKKLFKIMAIKKTNLCLSVDLVSASKILNLVESVGEHICLVKTHIDILEDFNQSFTQQLKAMSKKFNFLILEDRKYADIGNTVSLQHSNGMYKVSEWADIVTVHSLPGEGILKALSGIKTCGVFLLAEMSSADNLLTREYTEKTVKMAEKYQDLITGFVCQNKATFSNPGLIQLTPGVQLESSCDELGQVYNTPEKVIIDNGADIAVVGRGIIKAKNPETQAILYKETLWQCYLKRIAT